MDKWLTYQQGGELFGMSSEAFRQRARREGWRTQPGNDGRTLVLMPDGAAVRPRVRPPEQSAAQTPEQPPGQTSVQTPAQTPEHASTISGLAALLTEQHKERERLETDLRSERKAREQVQAELVAEKEARAKAEGVAEAERQAFVRADERADKAGAALALEREARTKAAELMRQAEAERDAFWTRGRFARALTAWKGRREG